MTKKRNNQRKAKSVKKLTRAVANLKTTPQAVAKEASLGRSILRLLGGATGGIAGLVTGGPAAAYAGGQAGYKAGNNAATILGMGKYHIAKNSLYKQALATGVPHMHSTSESTIIRHREFISDVYSSATANAFSVSEALSINPGQADTFPWLSTIASQYQEYTFKGLAFEFKSSSADAIANSTNTALGVAILGTQYNPVAPAFTSKTQMLNEYYTNDCKVSEDCIHYIECDPKENPFNIQYVRTGAVPTGGSVQNYDLGTFYMATSGVQGTNNNCGELWAVYEVELRKPIPANVQGTAADETTFYAYSTTNINTSNYFGSSPTAFGSWFGTSVTLTTTTIVFSGVPYVGPFMVIYNVGVGSSSQPVTISPTTNCIAYNTVGNGTTDAMQAGQGTTSGGITTCATFIYSQTSAIANAMTITFSGGTIGTPNAMNLFIVPIAQQTY